MSDLYARLGLQKGASTDEVRRAYKDLARSKHPDKGGSEEEFKAIQEAHEVLSDEGRRKMYDMTGSTSEGPGGPGGGMAAGGIPFHFMRGAGPFGMPGVSFDMGDMFSQFFGGMPPGMGGRPGGRKQKAPRGPNKHQDIGLTLADFYKGKDIKITFNQGRRCGSCNGSGAEKTEPCGACKGGGVRTLTQQIGPGVFAETRMACDVCSGEGTRIMRPCDTCKGKRFNEREKQLIIKITPGVREGETMVFEGECSDSLDYEAPGDVVLTLRRTDTGSGDIGEYEWKGDNLHIKKSITFAESILGFSMTLSDHPSGAKPTYVWRGGPLIHGAVVKMVGGGMPKKGGGYGDLLIQVMISAPPCVPWSAEDAAKLQSVLGGAAAVFGADGAQNLELSSSASQLGGASDS